MIQMQISLTHDMYREAKSAARRAGVSLAEFLRRALARKLGERKDAQQPWMSYAGVLSSGDPHASRSVNDVYRRPRP
ncbi:MAG: CopG family transcriptional regulator [Luteitalea sp.]|nr:CopG family transcriptional regulator [Luteitalea sp.]